MKQTPMHAVTVCGRELKLLKDAFQSKFGDMVADATIGWVGTNLELRFTERKDGPPVDSIVSFFKERYGWVSVTTYDYALSHDAFLCMVSEFMPEVAGSGYPSGGHDCRHYYLEPNGEDVTFLMVPRPKDDDDDVIVTY